MSERTAPAGEGADRQPTDEEVRAYLAQLRQTDVGEILAQAFSMLASGAEVKLGRRDARVLIDAAAAVEEAGGSRLEARMRDQMRKALNQLRLAQVDAEKQLAELRAEGKLPEEESGDVPADAAADAARAGGEEPAEEAGQTPPSASSRLWIPGR